MRCTSYLRSPAPFLPIACATAIVVVLTATTGAQAPASTRLNRLIGALEQGRAAMGTVNRQAPRSTDAARALAVRDLDFAVFDVEGGATDMTQFAASLGVLRDPAVLNGRPPVTPIVRIPRDDNDAPEAIVAALLDLGVFGVMFGHVDTAEQAARAVEAVRPQIGGPMRLPGESRPARYWGVSASRYEEAADVWPLMPRGELVVIMMVESPEAIRNLDAIAKVPGVAALFFGPGDYGRAIGRPSKLPVIAPETEEAVQAMLAACRRHGLACGYPVAGPPSALKEEADKRLAQGFTIVTQVNLQVF